MGRQAAITLVLLVLAIAGVNRGVLAAPCAGTVTNCANDKCQGSANTVCEECVSDAFYLNSTGSCHACDAGADAVAGCATCSSGGVCTSCTTSGDVITANGDACYSAPANCDVSASAGVCATCASTYTKKTDGTACFAPIANCDTVSATDGSCFACASTYYRSAPTSCSKCTTCTDGEVVETACNATFNTVCRIGALASGNVELKIMGQSGKFDLIPTDSSGKALQDKKLRVEMNSLHELDAAGAKVGTSGPQAGKHSKNTFATESFTITGPSDATYGGLACKKVEFSLSMVQGAATFKVDTFLFTEAGTITLGPANDATTPQESFKIHAGSVKFNVEIDSWPFCNGESGKPCDGATGVDLELTITVTGPTASTTRTDGNGTVVHDFGEGAAMRLSNLFSIGGVYEVAGDGDVVFADNDLVLRIPKPTGSNKVQKYDPILSFGDGSDDGGSGNAAPGMALPTRLLSLALVLVTLVLRWWA